MQLFETYVVVVGGGTAGMAAAVTAAENGASVIVFEKAPTTGGAGNMALGLFAVESRLQRLKQFPLTREEAFKIHMDFTHWRADARLVKAYIDKSASTIDWLEKLGLKFSDIGCHNPGYGFTWHIIKGPSGGTGASANMIKLLNDRAKRLGVKVFLRTSVRKIFKEDSRIAGVVVEDKSGEEIQANARAVIIATGSFGGNPEWIKKYTGYEWGRDLISPRIPSLAGDGIRMAWEAGAAETEMMMQLAWGLPKPFMGPGGTSVEFAAFQQPGDIMVNLSGERFANEEIMLSPFGGNAIARQKDRCAFVIFDEATKNYYEETGWDVFPPVSITLTDPVTKSSNLDANIKRAQDGGYKHLFTANSLEELCAKTGINLDGLRDTINEYNKACETGRDEVFCKNPKYLRPVKQPKFYAGKFYLSTIGSLGGIKINYKTEVLAKDYDVIPGLYAAGLDANTIYGDTYAFILPGNTLGFAVNSGRIAGENAARFALGK